MNIHTHTHTQEHEDIIVPTYQIKSDWKGNLDNKQFYLPDAFWLNEVNLI